MRQILSQDICTILAEGIAPIGLSRIGYKSNIKHLGEIMANLLLLIYNFYLKMERTRAKLDQVRGNVKIGNFGGMNFLLFPFLDTSGVFDNFLSALTMSELVKRIVLHRDVTLEHRIPGLQWLDAQTIMYGAEQSEFFSNMRWGGMTVDTAIYIQSADVDTISKGNWRIFSKLGSGYSSTRGVGETTTNSYACFPVLDQNGNPISDQGVEFVLTARSSVAGDTTLEKAEGELQKAIADVVEQIYSGKLQ